MVDPLFFEQALGNVLENAARHAGRSSMVRLRSQLTSVNGNGRYVDLIVEDAGRGVPNDQLGRLFERFYRVPATSPSTGGMGIGLSVARGFVAAMGGEMTAESSDLGGLAIRIRLPLPAEAVGEAGQSRA